MRNSTLASLMASLAIAGLGSCTPSAHAQSSASFRLSESTVNAGGRPSQGQVAVSASFKVSLDAIGAAAARVGLASSNFRADGTFVPRYRPPVEVLGLRFLDKKSLRWDFEPSVGVFNLYRGSVASLPASNYGSCFRNALTTNQTTDSDSPVVSSAYTYLVTAENRLSEEGTLGRTSSGVTRSNANPCP